MTRFHAMTVTGTVLAGLALPFCATGPASAAPSPWETYQEAYGPEVTENFCDVDGLALAQQGVADGRFRTTTHGSDGLDYYYDRAHFSDTWTNLATGELVTIDGFYKGGAKQITDNGDGTLTILIQNTDNTVYRADGQVIARDTGVFRYELLFDHAGTPTDPSDDVFLEFRIVKATGQQPDFCTTIVQAIG
jgi:hypothetical protein